MTDSYNIKVLYEDDHLLIIDKPAKIPVHPTSGHLFENIIMYLRDKYPNLTIRLLHRLDRETSGILLLSKELEIHRLLYKQFEKREIYKEYTALVHGVIEEDSNEISAPISSGNFEVKIKKMVDYKFGVFAKTDYRIIKRFANHTLLTLIPLTGKQHQLRLHLSYIGHPLVGDKIYGKSEKYFLEYLEGRSDEYFRTELGSDRHALHASCFIFYHPIKKERIKIESQLPKDFLELLDRLK